MDTRYRIRTLPIAEKELAVIDEYLSHFYESTAARFFERYDRQTSLLENMPYMGAVYKDYRRLVVLDYLVFYKVDEESKTVSIYRVLHGARDIERDLT
jgi:addiction module RelE/StbE family toxin